MKIQWKCSSSSGVNSKLSKIKFNFHSLIFSYLEFSSWASADKEKTKIRWCEQFKNLPENVKKSLEWTSTLRDVVFFLWEEDENPGDLYYLDSDASDGAVAFTTTPPAYPAGISKKRANSETRIASGNYKFRYVIVRYYKDSTGSWIGYFPMLQADSVSASSIDNIIVSAAGER